MKRNRSHFISTGLNCDVLRKDYEHCFRIPYKAGETLINFFQNAIVSQQGKKIILSITTF